MRLISCCKCANNISRATLSRALKSEEKDIPSLLTELEFYILSGKQLFKLLNQYAMQMRFLLRWAIVP
jgi:hypothetical protein